MPILKGEAMVSLVTKELKGTAKFHEEKLALGLLGNIIEQVEEYTPKNMNWVESIERIKNNAWKFTIKHKSDYFPQSIKKYVSRTKKMMLTGTLYDIEEELTNIWKDKRYTNL